MDSDFWLLWNMRLCPFIGSEKVWFLLNLIESEIQFIEPLKTEIQNLSLKLRFLIAILHGIGKSHIQDDCLQALLDRANSIFENEWMEYTQLFSDFSPELMGESSMPINMDGQISRMLKGLHLLLPEVQEIYTILSKSSSRTKVEMTDELIIEHLNFILQNMGDLLGCKADYIVPLKEEIQTVQKSLTSLRDFLGFALKRCSKLWKLKDLVILAEAVADNISCLLYLCLVKSNMDDQMLSQMKLELSKQLQNLSPVNPDVRKIYIQTLKALKSERNPTPLDESALGFLGYLQDNLPELLSLSDNKLSFMNSIRNLLFDRHGELRFLRDLTMDSPWNKYNNKVAQKFEHLWEHSDAFIKEAGYVIYSLYDYDENGSMAREFKSAASHLLADIKVAKEDAKNIYNQFFPKSLRTNFPATDKLGSINFIFENMKAVLVSQAALVAPLKVHIEEILKDLQLLREDFTAIAELEDRFTRFKDLVYNTERVIDLLVCKGTPRWLIKLGLFDIIEEIKMTKTEIKSIKNREASACLGGISCLPAEKASPEDTVNAALSSYDMGDENNLDLIFGQEAQKIREQIITGHEKLEILSIVGMPGVGKTTLANSVFQHSSVTDCFHVLARCYVTQVYSTKRLFLELLKHITGEAKRWQELSEEDLAQKLYQRLKCRKYVIFMDDVWSFEPLDKMRASLPDDETGSRILLTSRFDNIVSKDDYISTTYRLSPLSDKKSWELLQAKIFASGSCPQALVEVGKEMATICRGLPLLVDVVAGFLRAADTKRDAWQRVAECLKSQPVDDLQGRCRMAIELSYNILPDHLKACFLYFAAFPKGHEISTWKLTTMWIAEGFVQQVLNDDATSLEAAAKTYLGDLIARSLVTISKTGHLGNVKASRIHDLLHDFTLAKAKEDNFLLQIQKYDADLTNLPALGYLRSEECRLCFYPNNENDLPVKMVYGPRVRTIHCTYLPFSFLALCFNFKLIRVLELSNVETDSPDAIATLIHLRFLALYVLEEKYLKEVHKLQKLETFFLEKAYANEDNGVMLLEHISGMEKLRHFRLTDSFIWEYQSEGVFEKLQLQNLLSLSCPKLCYGRLSEKLMERMPNLQKMSCIFLDSWDSARNCNLFSKLELLRKLESLKVTYNGNRANGLYPCKFSFPPYIKKVALASFVRPWNEISVLGKLQHLEILMLGSRAFKGETWKVRDGEFLKLKSLSFFELDVEEWIVSDDHFPCLEKLNMVACKKFKKLPSCLGEKATLKKIYLSKCRVSVGLSATIIKKEQLDNGNEQFVLNIRRPIQDETAGIIEQLVLSITKNLMRS